MKIEELLPRKETVEKIGISLEEISTEIKGLSQENLINHPRDYILRGRIDAKILREIRKLGIEFSISGEKGRLVFSSGSVHNIEPKQIVEMRNYLVTDFPTNSERYARASYSMHSHDSDLGIMPSSIDVNSLANSKNNVSLIFTVRGIVAYTWDKEFNFPQKNFNFLLLKTQGIENFSILDDDEKIKALERYTSSYNLAQRIEIDREFFNSFNVIVSDVAWEEEKK